MGSGKAREGETQGMGHKGVGYSRGRTHAEWDAKGVEFLDKLYVYSREHNLTISQLKMR